MSLELSRRAFAQIIGTGTALAAVVPLRLLAKTPEQALRLSANENPLGASPLAIAAMRDALSMAWSYPDEAADALIDDIARLHGVANDQVILGAGSSEILHVAALAFLSPQRKLVTADPTFESLGASAKALNAGIVKIPLDANHAHDLPQMLAASRYAGLVYICNPNNPTATLTAKDDVRKFITSVPSTTGVLVDEAYHHYVTSDRYESVIPLIAVHPNLVVARTFSKIYGMAGLRCGYAVGQRGAIARLAAQQQWDSVNCVALAAARASLADRKWAADGQRQNSQTRQWLTSQLDRLGYRVLPSEANFVMIDMRREVRPIITSFRERGVRVGQLFPARPQHMRVTIGTPEQMKRFASTFAEVVKL